MGKANDGLWLAGTALLAVGSVIGAAALGAPSAGIAAGAFTAQLAAELLKTVAGGVGCNLFSSGAEGLRKRLTNQRPSLENQHLVRAVGRAIELYCTVRLAKDLPEHAAFCKKLGAAAPGVWRQIAAELDPAYEAAEERNLPLLLAAAERGESMFGAAAWERLADLLLEAAGPAKGMHPGFRESLRDRIARDLPRWFVHDLREVLKENQSEGDKLQFAAFELQAIREAISSRQAIHDAIAEMSDSMLAEFRITRGDIADLAASIDVLRGKEEEQTQLLREIKQGQQMDRETATRRHSEIMESHSEIKNLLTSPSCGFDLERYRTDYLLANYRRVRAAELGTAGASVAIDVWQIFVPPKARMCGGFDAVLEQPTEDESLDLYPEHLTKEEREKRKREFAAFREQPAIPVLDVVAYPKHRRLVILGAPGAGKSMLLNHLALGWARQDAPEDRAGMPVPILIEFRRYESRRKGRSDFNFFDYLSEPDGAIRLDATELQRLFRTPGGAVCYLDALDEVFDATDRERATQLILNLAKDYPELPIILTSRHYEFASKLFGDAGFSIFMLQDFELASEIPDFLKLFFGLPGIVNGDTAPLRDRILAAMPGNEAVLRLAGNPLLLTMICLVGRTRELPERRVELYEKATELLLEQWGLQLPTPPGCPKLQYYQKVELMCRIAYTMQVGNAAMRGNVIDEKRLHQTVRSYLEVQGWKGDEANAHASGLIAALRERNFMLAFLGARHFAFVHRAFLEYFAALYLHEELANNDRFEEVKALVTKHWTQTAWHEVFRLFAGMQTKPKRAIDLVLLLLDQNAEDEISNALLASELFREIPNRTTDAREEKARKALFRALRSHTEDTCVRFDRTRPQDSSQVRAARLIISARLCTDPVRWVATNHAGSRFGAPTFMLPYLLDDLALYHRDEPNAHVLFSRLADKCDSRAIRILAERWRDEPGTLQLMKKLARAGNSTAIWQLAKRWRDDPETLPLVRDLAQRGNPEAIEQLAGHLRDNPQTLPLVRELARQGNDRAIFQLAQRWRDDPDTLPLLRILAREGNQRAIRLVARRWGDYPGTLPLVKDLARSGDDTAIRLLAEYWRVDPETLPLVKDFARKGDGQAIKVLAEHWRGDPETLPLVKDLARQGEGAAIEVLADHWHDDPETLEFFKSLARDGNAAGVGGCSLRCRRAVQLLASRHLDALALFPWLDLLTLKQPTDPERLARARWETGLTEDQIRSHIDDFVAWVESDDPEPPESIRKKPEE